MLDANELIDSFQEEKSVFAAKAQQLNEEQLGFIVERILIESSTSVIRKGDRKLQIIIDSIQQDVLLSLNT